MKIDRLVSIIMILLEKKRIGALELARMFEVSKRTIYRDIEAINMAGIPVFSTPGAGGGFEITENYKVDKKVFSTNDLSAILMGLSGLSGMIRGDELVSAFAKVKSFIPADQAKEIELKTNQIFVDLSPWMGSGNIQPYLELIKTALEEKRLLTFQYINHKGNTTSRQAEPHRLVLKAGQWYFQGYCRKREDFRLFKLSRIWNLQLQKDKFTPREFGKTRLDMPERLASMQKHIKIRIHKSIMERVLDYCPFENFTPDGKEHYTVRFPFIENDYYYSILFSFGDKCQCLEPQPIRSEMMRRIEDLAGVYHKNVTARESGF